METHLVGPSPPAHPESKCFQHPINAVQIFLDRAISVMKANEAITQEDVVWFYKYLEWIADDLHQTGIKKEQGEEKGGG